MDAWGRSGGEVSSISLPSKGRQGGVSPATRETAGDVGPAAKEEAAGDAVDLVTKKGARFCMKRAP